MDLPGPRLSQVQWPPPQRCPITDLFTLYKTPSSSMPSRWMEKRGDFSSDGRYGAASLGRQRKVRGHLPTPHPVTPRHSTVPQHRPLHGPARPAASLQEGYQRFTAKSARPPKPVTRMPHPLCWGLIPPETPPSTHRALVLPEPQWLGPHHSPRTLLGLAPLCSLVPPSPSPFPGCSHGTFQRDASTCAPRGSSQGTPTVSSSAPACGRRAGCQ